MQDPLLQALVTYCELYHKPFSASALSDGLPIGEDGMLFSHKNSKFSLAVADSSFERKTFR